MERMATSLLTLIHRNKRQSARRTKDEETGECEENQDNDESKDDNVSADSTDPDLCLKIRGQIARATSQKELDSISIPPQCIASKVRK